MIAATIPRPQFMAHKLKSNKSPALAFMGTIDSSWKGHAAFALWLVERLKPKTIVDLGFDRGLSTLAFAYKNRGHVFGIDWFDETNYATKCFALDSAFRTIMNAIRFSYVKNVHLIVGPFKDVMRTWNRKIDILHIDCVHTYQAVKQHYDNWSPYLNEDAVILIHDIGVRKETKRFFNELPLHKVIFPHSEGLGVASHDEALIQEIRAAFLQ